MKRHAKPSPLPTIPHHNGLLGLLGALLVLALLWAGCSKPSQPVSAGCVLDQSPLEQCYVE
jgi:hypothetical protein